jgi:signal transduction histidine kinase
MTHQKLLFSDLIDVHKAQELLDGYYAVTGIPTGIIDGTGKVWTASGWLDICTRFHRIHPETLKMCIQSDTYIADHLHTGREYVSYRCAHGLTDVASPIIVAGQHVAQVMTGQLFTRQPDLEFFRQQAQRYGFDEQAYLRALAEVPVITEEKLDVIMKFLVQLAQFLADMGYRRLKETEAQQEVLRLNRELERRVVERTAELQEAQTHLIQTEKLAALGDLVAGLSHEISTPTGVAVTAVSHLAQKTDAFEELVAEGQVRRSDLDKFLAVCRDSAEITLLNLRRAAELVASFKRVAVDQSSEERRTFKVKEYLHEILLSLRPKLKHANFSVQVHCDEKLELDHYPGTFSQIITNLVVNTLMHGYLDDERGLVTITMERVKDRYLLRYADDGKGIEPQHIGRIFDPFFTTRRGQGGTGLGLFILHNLVTQKLGGTVSCESSPGQGTIFTIKFPVERQKEAA